MKNDRDENAIAEHNEEIFYKHIPLFDDAPDKNRFKEWMRRDAESVNFAKQKFSSKCLSAIRGVMPENYRNNLTVMELLKKFRNIILRDLPTG